MNHPLPTGGTSLYLRKDVYSSGARQNVELEKEALSLVDTFRAMDNGPEDLNKAPGYVRLQSPGGRVVTDFSFRERSIDLGGFRDREGYWENHSKTVLDHAQYSRTELGKSGRATKSVVVSFNESPSGSMVSKTVQDKHGKSIATGGGSRDYEVAYFPGDSISARA